MLIGGLAPIFEEYVLDNLPVEGEIPAGLNGVYLRNGPTSDSSQTVCITYSTGTAVACRCMPTINNDGSIDAHQTAKNIANLKMDARSWRYRMNLKTGEAKEACLDPDRNVEFPGYDSSRTRRRTRWGYLVDHDPEILRWTGIRKYDTDSAESVGEWSDREGSHSAPDKLRISRLLDETEPDRDALIIRLHKAMLPPSINPNLGGQ
jgi:carotenoid cleavage dioxygenase-like enzyme